MVRFALCTAKVLPGVMDTAVEAFASLVRFSAKHKQIPTPVSDRTVRIDILVWAQAWCLCACRMHGTDDMLE